MSASIYARAKRGELLPALSIPDVCRLNTASLNCPYGRYTPGDDLARRLRQLVALGLVTPERSEEVSTPGQPLASIGGRPVLSSPFIHVDHWLTAEGLRTVLADLGEVGPLLSAWVLAGVVPPRVKDTDEPWYVLRVCNFCEVVLASGDIDPDHSGLTAMDIVEAMLRLELWHRPEKGRPSKTSLERYVRTTAGKHVVFVAGKPANCPDHEQRHLRAVAQLVSIYRRARQETLTRIDPEPASSFRACAAG